MKDFYNRYNGPSIERQLHKSIWILFLFLLVIMMIIPSIIVFVWGADSSHFKRFLNDSKQSSVPYNEQKYSIKGQASSQRSPLTIGWVIGNGSTIQHLADYHNLKVVSLALASVDNQYNLKVNSDSLLSKSIRKQEKKIWARIIMQTDTNSNVHTFLSNPIKTQGVINKILQTAITNDWYGVNLDIENVSVQDRNAFSQFVKNLSSVLNQSTLILSIDLPPDPVGNSNKQAPFDHEVIGKYCDYIIFMGYDQHWSTDPVPGPVTSLSWLKGNLKEFIQTEIPPEKIILGLPAYTRIWQQNQKDYIVKDPAQSVQHVENLVTQNHRELTWDSNMGEYYTSYTANNMQYKIWLPTVKSFNIYLGLIPQFHLAGSALWNLNLMNSDYWNRIY